MYAIVNRVTLELSVHWHSNLSVIEAECSFFFFGGGGGGVIFAGGQDVRVEMIQQLMGIEEQNKT